MSRGHSTRSGVFDATARLSPGGRPGAGVAPSREARAPADVLTPGFRGRAGGADRVRTGDPLVANQVLSQLSYSPGLVRSGGPKWI